MENDLNILEEETKSDENRKNNASYWKRMMRGYEKRNASLERRHAALVERVHFMECALPSLLMSAAVVSTNRTSEQSPKVSSERRQRASLTVDFEGDGAPNRY